MNYTDTVPVLCTVVYVWEIRFPPCKPASNQIVYHDLVFLSPGKGLVLESNSKKNRLGPARKCTRSAFPPIANVGSSYSVRL